MVNAEFAVKDLPLGRTLGLNNNNNKINPWRYSPEEPRSIDVVATRWQYRGPCG